jgi:hypothetical protein
VNSSFASSFTSWYHSTLLSIVRRLSQRQSPFYPPVKQIHSNSNNKTKQVGSEVNL